MHAYTSRDFICREGFCHVPPHTRTGNLVLGEDEGKLDFSSCNTSQNCLHVPLQGLYVFHVSL